MLFKKCAGYDLIIVTYLKYIQFWRRMYIDADYLVGFPYESSRKIQQKRC